MRRGPGYQYDWEDAFKQWVDMGPGRTLTTLAKRLGADKRTVQRHAAENDWEGRLARIEVEVRKQTDKILVRERSERVADTLRIIDAARTKFAGQLRISEFRLTGSDFVGLIKLEQLLEGEATSRIDVGEVQALLGVVLEIFQRRMPAGELPAAMGELDGAVAQLTARAAA